MTNLKQDRPGVLARHRKVLMAGVFGLGALGLVAADGLLLQPSTSAFAAAPVTAGITGVQPSGFADIVDKVSPAVVSVKVKTVTDSSGDDDDQSPAPRGNRQQFNMPDLPPNSPLNRFFRQFGFGDPNNPNGPMGQQHGRRQFGMAQGSGFFISADGYIVTNNHVVEHSTEVDVVTNEGKTLTAKVIGTDPKTDLALIKVDGKEFPYVDLSSRSPRVGDWVIAVGNPFGLGGTVTAGIVSARGRDIGSGPYDDFIQIDAPVNRGNSGGPTFDTQGNVIGVNTAIFSPSGGSVGIGFAIPAETVKRVVAELQQSGSVTRGWIGVQIQPVTAEIADSIGLKTQSGALVADVSKGGPAADAGIRSGDAITAVNGEEVKGPRELAKMVAQIKPGTGADLTVWRDGSERTVKVSTGKLPGDVQKADAQQDEDDGDDQPKAVAGLGLQLAPAGSVSGAGNTGVVVTEVDPQGSAADSLQAGDVIVDVGGKPVKNVNEVRQGVELSRQQGRKSVLLRVKSGDNLRFVALPVSKADNKG